MTTVTFEVSSEVEKKTLFQIGYRPAGYRLAVHPREGLANLSEVEYSNLKAEDRAAHSCEWCGHGDHTHTICKTQCSSCR